MVHQSNLNTEPSKITILLEFGSDLDPATTSNFFLTKSLVTMSTTYNKYIFMN